MAVTEEPTESIGRGLSLQTLQNLVRRDPIAYEQEYRLQFRNFQTTAESFHMSPGKPNKRFQELVSFISHVYSCYPELASELDFPGTLFRTLNREPERIHPAARKSLVQAVLLLLTRDAVTLLTVLKEMFKLFAVEDRELRGLLHARLVKEIASRTTPGGKKSTRKPSKGLFVASQSASEVRRDVEDFLLKKISSSQTHVLFLRAASSICLGLFKRRAWCDKAAVNKIFAELALNADSKVASAAMHVFLGTAGSAAVQLLEGIDDEKADAKSGNKEKEDDDDDEENDKKKKKRKRSKGDEVSDFVAIDLLFDPQSFSEKVLAMASATSKFTFEFRILALRLVSRLVYRHQLILLNLYPFIQRHLYPSNKNVTRVLACLAQACHSGVPPEEMQGVVRHLIDNFISDHCRPEVITVGLNALRGICERAPLVLEQGQLADIVEYRNQKISKSVAGAARALLNLYRSVYPELLHKSLRGKEAALAVQEGTAPKPEFGQSGKVYEDIECEEVVSSPRKKRQRQTERELSHAEDEKSEVDECASDAGSNSEGEEEECEDAESELDEVNDSSEGSEIEEEDSDSSNQDEDNDAEEEEAEEEEEHDWILDPDNFGSTAPRKSRKQLMLDKMSTGKSDRKSAFLDRVNNRKGGLTNKEKNRMKPVMMSVKKSAIQKRNMTANQKVRQMKKHIKNLRKQVGPQKRRRTRG